MMERRRFPVTRAILVLSTLTACFAAYAQPGEKLEFEVASIKPAPPPDGRGVMVRCDGGPGTKDPGMFTCQNMSLPNLLSRAYGVAFYRLQTPDWMQPMNPMFDLNVKVPQNTTKEQFNVMLQNLLADRFNMVVHLESREMQQYELVVTKGGPKFKEAPPEKPKDDSADQSPRPAPKPAPLRLDNDGYPNLTPGRLGMAIMNGRARLYNPQMTMAMLAGQVSGQMGKPVADMTGLTAKYEIGLYWVAESLNDSATDPVGPTLVQALQDQLGLKLESKKGPVDFLIVDRSEKTPKEN
jgi:uncharacterized protein (TIGR03435 family)